MRMEGSNQITPQIAVNVGVNVVPFGATSVSVGINSEQQNEDQMSPMLLPASRSYTAAGGRITAPPASS
jgi:hypothetical protein